MKQRAGIAPRRSKRISKISKLLNGIKICPASLIIARKLENMITFFMLFKVSKLAKVQMKNKEK